MSILKVIWNYFFGKKKATTENVTEELREFHKEIAPVEDKPQRDFGCQLISVPPLEHCEEPQAEETIIPAVYELKDVSKQNNLIPSRFEGESFAEYKKRQALAKLFLKKKQKGEMVHLSQKILYDKTGTKKSLLFEKGKTFTRTNSK